MLLRQAVPAGTGSARAGLVTAFVTLLVVGTDLFVVSPLLPSIAAGYDVSVGAAGSSVTVFAVAYLVGAPLMGVLADRIGRRAVLVAGLVVFALANVLTGLAPTFLLLLASRMVAGLGACSVTPSVQALVAAVAPAGRRGSWLAVAVAGFLISLTTGAPTGAALGSALGWRAAFAGLGCLGLALAVVNLLVWPARAGAAAGVAAGVAAPAGRIPLPAKVRAVSVTGLWAFAVYGLYTYLGTGLREVAGLSTGAVAVALILFGIGAVSGSLLGGRLADRFGAREISSLSLLLLAAVQVAAGLVLHAPVPVLLVVLGLFALVAYPCLPAFQVRLAGAFAPQLGSVFAWNSCFMYLGTSLGAAVGGVLFSTVSFESITWAGAAAGIVGAVVCARLAISPERENRPA
jgi:predicted MFS family arabinose efflux permease